MNKSLQQVAEFHTTFEHPIAENPIAEESLRIRQLRIKLLFEELAELAEASDCKRTMSLLCDTYCVKLAETHGGVEMTAEEFREQSESILDARNIHDGDTVNKTEELDALCDIQYVLNGKILTSGLHSIFDKAFDVVHNNNMSKAHCNVDHCRETVAALGDSMEHYTINPKGEGVVILMNKSGKVIKPHNHVKVKLNILDLVSENDPNFPG